MLRNSVIKLFLLLTLFLGVTSKEHDKHVDCVSIYLKNFLEWFPEEPGSSFLEIRYNTYRKALHRDFWLSSSCSDEADCREKLCASHSDCDVTEYCSEMVRFNQTKKCQNYCLKFPIDKTKMVEFFKGFPTGLSTCNEDNDCPTGQMCSLNPLLSKKMSSKNVPIFDNEKLESLNGFCVIFHKFKPCLMHNSCKRNEYCELKEKIENLNIIEKKLLGSNPAICFPRVWALIDDKKMFALLDDSYGLRESCEDNSCPFFLHAKCLHQDEHQLHVNIDGVSRDVARFSVSLNYRFFCWMPAEDECSYHDDCESQKFCAIVDSVKRKNVRQCVADPTIYFAFQSIKTLPLLLDVPVRWSIAKKLKVGFYSCEENGDCPKLSTFCINDENLSKFSSFTFPKHGTCIEDIEAIEVFSKPDSPLFFNTDWICEKVGRFYSPYALCYKGRIVLLSPKVETRHDLRWRQRCQKKEDCDLLQENAMCLEERSAKNQSYCWPFLDIPNFD